MLRKPKSMSTCTRPILQATIIALLASILATNGFAQAKEPRFDVVLIKPLGDRPPPPNVGDVILPGGTFRDPGTTLRELLFEAYDIDDVAHKVIDFPKWAETALFAVTAKAGPNYPAATNTRQNQENVRAMLRSMLADRFQLKLHQEERKAKVLLLQVKGGDVKKGSAKLQPVAEPVPPEKEGWPTLSLSDRRGSITGKKVTLARLATRLAYALNQLVEDRTGLTGFYDFNEKWVAQYPEGGPVPPDTLGAEGLAQLMSDLDQNLGLVLKPDTVPVKFWVVDHVEMPSEN
ncbi:MAG: TIGR03435 family protein [Acidobacteriota bacterium]